VHPVPHRRPQRRVLFLLLLFLECSDSGVLVLRAQRRRFRAYRRTIFSSSLLGFWRVIGISEWLVINGGFYWHDSLHELVVANVPVSVEVHPAHHVHELLFQRLVTHLDQEPAQGGLVEVVLAVEVDGFEEQRAVEGGQLHEVALKVFQLGEEAEFCLKEH
jgi:hypothetical protein